jgi:protein gp37
MSDLFHDHFTNAQIDSVLDVIYEHPQHIYFILTKRPERMQSMTG